MDLGEEYNNTLWSGSAVNHQGACPAGWHMPSGDEWTALTDNIGGLTGGGRKLKASGDYWAGNGITVQPGGDDSYGFSAVPTGLLFDPRDGGSPYYTYKTSQTSWWSSEESAANRIWTRSLSNANNDVARDRNYKSYKLPVRCVQNQ
jgi:uncharacterized protein (TIGR02145 family)